MVNDYYAFINYDPLSAGGPSGTGLWGGGPINEDPPIWV